MGPKKHQVPRTGFDVEATKRSLRLVISAPTTAKNQKKKKKKKKKKKRLPKK